MADVQPKSTKTVNVYCKLPSGIRYPLPDGSELKINGFHHRDAVAGFGITRRVDAEAWDAVVKAHGNSAAHKNGLIFAKASADEEAGEKEAVDKASVKSGFEPIEPSVEAKTDAATGEGA